MKKKNIMIITLGLVGMLAGSSFLYHSLSKDYTEESQSNTELIQEDYDQEEMIVKDARQAENLEKNEHFEEENYDSNPFESDIPTNSESMENTQEITSNDVNASLSGNSTANSKEETTITNESSNSVNNNSSSSVTSTPSNDSTLNTPTPTHVPTITATPIPTKVPTYNPEPTKAPTLIPEPTKAPIVTNTAANFTVQDYSGNNVSLSSFFGKPIVINFWASWCGPCKSEMPAFQSVYQDYKNDVVFLMVNMVDGYRETKENGYKYIKGQGFTFPVYYDVKQSAAYAYGITSYPTTYFIDANGNVANYTKGSMSESTLRRQVQSLLH